MIDQLLSDFSRTPGLQGAALFSRERHCLGHTLQPPYDPILCVEILEKFDAMTAIAASLDDGESDSLVMLTDIGLMLIRRFPELTLLALASAQTSASMLHVACNSVGLKLNRMTRAQNAPPAGNPPPFPSAGQSGHHLSQPSVTNSAPPPLPIDPSMSASLTGASLSRSIMGSHVAAYDVPRDAVGTAFVKHSLRVLRRYVGDQAKFVLKEELNRMGVRPQTLRKGQVTDFLDSLARAIPSRSERARFRSDVLGV